MQDTPNHENTKALSMYKNDLQWNPDITMYQGTGEITSLYRGIVKPGIHCNRWTISHWSLVGIDVFLFVTVNLAV